MVRDWRRLRRPPQSLEDPEQGPVKGQWEAPPLAQTLCMSLEMVFNPTSPPSVKVPGAKKPSRPRIEVQAQATPHPSCGWGYALRMLCNFGQTPHSLRFRCVNYKSSSYAGCGEC